MCMLLSQLLLLTLSTLLNKEPPVLRSFLSKTQAKLPTISSHLGKACSSLERPDSKGFELLNPGHFLKMWRHVRGSPFDWKQFLYGRGPWAWLSFHYSLHLQGTVFQECFCLHSDRLNSFSLECLVPRKSILTDIESRDPLPKKPQNM